MEARPTEEKFGLIAASYRGFLASEMAELSLVYCPKGQLTLLPEAGHWLQHEEPTTVSQALKEFFAARD